MLWSIMITLLFTGCSDNEHVVTTWQTKLQEQQRFFLMAMPVVSKKKILAHTCALVPSETMIFFQQRVISSTQLQVEYCTGGINKWPLFMCLAFIKVVPFGSVFYSHLWEKWDKLPLALVPLGTPQTPNSPDSLECILTQGTTYGHTPQ